MKVFKQNKTDILIQYAYDDVLKATTPEEKKEATDRYNSLCKNRAERRDKIISHALALGGIMIGGGIGIWKWGTLMYYEYKEHGVLLSTCARNAARSFGKLPTIFK